MAHPIPPLPPSPTAATSQLNADGDSLNLQGVQQVGGGLAVPTQPREMVYPLRRDRFELLCEVETINDDKRWRDAALAFFAAAVAGSIGLMAALDWGSTLTNKRWPTVIFTGVLWVLTMTSLSIFIYFLFRVRRTSETGAFSRVKSEIKKWYEEHP